MEVAIRSSWSAHAGPDRRRAVTRVAEDALVELFARADPPGAGVALAAVGSLARSELGPHSDLDLVLLHDGRQGAGLEPLSERLWYPLWDARVKLDHAVRTPAECAVVAGREVSAGVGLLDLRWVAGDAALVTSTRSDLVAAWRRDARRRLPELVASLEERHARFGDAADLLEPDLKEARGGLRDFALLRALAASSLSDRPRAGIDASYGRLLDVRDALHLSAGRALDRLLAGEVDAVASRLGCPDGDELHTEVSLAARHIAQALDLTLRAARQAAPQRRLLGHRHGRGPRLRQAGHGLIVHAGEVGLGRGDVADDPLTGLRVAALAAEEGLTVSPVTADNLGARATALPQPWPEAARDALLRFLSAGPDLLVVWEALDLAGCVTGWLPEWQHIRARPQHNPLHRHTVDRHCVQTVVEAHRHLTRVDRPDLLLMAALLHDIGKVPGTGAEHPRHGAPVARQIAERMGFAVADTDLVARLVAEHLTLAELATRRDHADPATTDRLVEAVQGRGDVLTLLHCLTEADARAAGPAAWSPWRASLINALAAQVGQTLSDPGRRLDPTALVDLGLARSVRLDGRPRVRAEPRTGGVQLTIAAPDRLGLFGDTAGLLASHGIKVRSAVLHTVAELAVDTWRVDIERVDELPDSALLVQQLQRLQAGDRAPLARVRRREARSDASPVGSREAEVDLVRGASASASVVEVRTPDRTGLLYALGHAVADIGLSIRSAHASTLAGQAVDTFYLTEAAGARPTSDREQVAIAALLAAARSGPAAAASPVTPD